jgi:futalosine hydrolase
MDSAPGGLLVVAATDFELTELRARLQGSVTLPGRWTTAEAGVLGRLPVVTQALGVGKARTAAGLASAILAHHPRAVVQVGVGGAYVGSFLSVGMMMLADSDIELDLGVATGNGWADASAMSIPLLGGVGGGVETVAHPALTQALADLSGLPRGRFATLDAITTDTDVGAQMAAHFDVSIESMEGAAAGVVAARLGVPWAQWRAVSNIAGERDRALWDLRGAAKRAAHHLALALEALPEHPSWTGFLAPN